MMRLRRLEFSAETKRLAFDRSTGICECHRVPQLMALLANRPCGVALVTGQIRYEHIDPNGIRPDDTLSNCATLTTTCWRLKTDQSDLPVIAEAKRREDRQHGIRPLPRQVLMGTHASGVTRGFDGVPRWRDSGRQWPSGPRETR